MLKFANLFWLNQFVSSTYLLCAFDYIYMIIVGVIQVTFWCWI
ncbi:hypothetical protein HMPREF1572_01229 [Gardnerella vaginalis JCP7275]|nr:hypothetical protein HMPREF1572_01229 [Gardnerella vaginalis JCP7275]